MDVLRWLEFGLSAVFIVLVVMLGRHVEATRRHAEELRGAISRMPQIIHEMKHCSCGPSCRCCPCQEVRP